MHLGRNSRWVLLISRKYYIRPRKKMTKPPMDFQLVEHYPFFFSNGGKIYFSDGMCVTVIRMCSSISTVQKVDKTEILNLNHTQRSNDNKSYRLRTGHPVMRSCAITVVHVFASGWWWTRHEESVFHLPFFETPRILDLTICALHRRNNWYVFISENKTAVYKTSWSKIAEIDNTVNLFLR